MWLSAEQQSWGLAACPMRQMPQMQHAPRALHPPCLNRAASFVHQHQLRPRARILCSLAAAAAREDKQAQAARQRQPWQQQGQQQQQQKPQQQKQQQRSKQQGNKQQQQGSQRGYKQQQQQGGEGHVPRVYIGASTAQQEAAQGLLTQLAKHKQVELRASGSANYFIAIGVLATALQQQQQRQQHDPAGGSSNAGALAAVCHLQEPEFEVSELQKRLRTLVLTVQRTAAPLDPGSWEDPGLRLSTNRTRELPAVAAALQEGLAEPQQGLLLEARGEQAVARGLKALLSSQAALGQGLALTAWFGPVADVVAEKAGQGGRRVLGTCLLVQPVSIVQWEQ